MIYTPRKIDRELLQSYTNKVRYRTKQLTPDMWDAGILWYMEAHDIAFDMAQEFGYTLDIVAAVLAGLSPQTYWADNVLRTRQMLTEHRHYGHMPWLSLNGGQDRKVWRILNTRDTSQLKGIKEYAFYRNITDPTGDEVTIDRWMYYLLGMKKHNGLMSKLRSWHMGEAIRRTAHRLDIFPSSLQAMLWVYSRGAVR